MLKKLSLLLFVLNCIAGYGQDVTATLKTLSSATPGKDLTVEISVNKAGVNGFMKYFQELPAGYTASDIDSKSGNFTNADNGAKIIWISPPSADQFVINYKIGIPQSASGTISLGGKFSYVVGSERKTFDVSPQTITIGGGTGSTVPAETPKEIVKVTPPPAEVKHEEPKPSPPVEQKPLGSEKTTPPPVHTEEKPKPAETKKENPVVTTTPVTKAPTAAAPPSGMGKSYRVQVGAFAQKPHLQGVPQPSTVVLDNGMTKYFSGNFPTYEEAKKRKNELLDKGFQGAFIVSFENGKIIK